MQYPVKLPRSQDSDGGEGKVKDSVHSPAADDHGKIANASHHTTSTIVRAGSVAVGERILE